MTKSTSCSHVYLGKNITNVWTFLFFFGKFQTTNTTSMFRSKDLSSSHFPCSREVQGAERRQSPDSKSQNARRLQRDSAQLVGHLGDDCIVIDVSLKAFEELFEVTGEAVRQPDRVKD